MAKTEIIIYVGEEKMDTIEVEWSNYEDIEEQFILWCSDNGYSEDNDDVSWETKEKILFK